MFIYIYEEECVNLLLAFSAHLLSISSLEFGFITALLVRSTAPNSHQSFVLSKMGIFSAKGVTYKAAKDVDLGPNSDEFYLKANVKGSINHTYITSLFSMW